MPRTPVTRGQLNQGARAALLMIGTLSLFGGCAATPPEPSHPSRVQGAVATQPLPLADLDAFKIVAGHSGKCLDVDGASAVDGTEVLQWDCNSRPHQLWRLETRPDGAVRFVALHSGKCLSIAPAGSPAQGYAVQMGCDRVRTDEGQWWVATAVSNSRYRLVSPNGAECLDIEASSIENGALVLQYICRESATNQEWAFIPLAVSRP